MCSKISRVGLKHRFFFIRMAIFGYILIDFENPNTLILIDFLEKIKS